MTTGAELRALRKRVGVSAAKAARQCEVAERTWKRWEASPTVPDSIVKLFRLVNNVRDDEGR